MYISTFIYIAMVNFLNGLESLISEWDDQTPREPDKDKDLIFVNGEEGTINSNGKLSCLEASIFSRNSRIFEDAIEKGVKSLVLYLTDSVGLITYTSCEGHRVNRELNILKHRNVGILPRNLEEYNFVKYNLKQVESFFVKLNNNKCVQVTIDENFVESENGKMPCIDILFLPKLGKENDYFLALEEVYQNFLELTKRQFKR
ncbi:MAG: hypothetical protein MUF13_03230 [Akkermansiaceae bacterium]|nr:hypothetical protein [Akkermansiaceae bacterium]